MNLFTARDLSGTAKKTLGLLLLSLLPLSGAAQPPACFVDGYHGGIYGHYPVEWKTRFIVDQLEAHPEWRIGLEIEPETWDTVALRTPADYRRLQRIAASERVEFTNPTYAQPYCYNISGESIIRQFAYGIAKIRSHFPDVEFRTYAVEEPCFTSALPQILRGFGFRYASLKCPNTCWGGYAAPHGGELVDWVGPDGSAILASPRYACEALQKNSVWQTTAWGNETVYLDACRRQGIAHPVGMCYQDAGWRYGPWLGAGDSIRNGSTYVTWREYFERIADPRTAREYRMPQEDVCASLVWGSQVMQRIARQVRHTEEGIVAAEKISALAQLLNGFEPDRAQIDEAWRTLMLAQHHDSWIVPYNGLHGQSTWADHIARWTSDADARCAAVVDAAAESFSAGASDGRLRILVCNTLAAPRRSTVAMLLPDRFGAGVTLRDARGRKVDCTVEPSGEGPRLFFTADVAAFGHTTYTATPARTSQRPHSAATDDVLENDMYRLRFDARRGGIIASLVAKFLDNKELVDAGSDYALGELRGYFYEEARFRSSTEAPARIEVLTGNAWEQRIRIRGTIASHPFTQTVTLRRGDRKIDFDLQIDWQHDTGIGEFRQEGGFADNRRAFYDGRYKLNFYLPVALDTPELYKEAPFDVCLSRHKNTFFSTWDSIKHDIILHWLDLSERQGGCGLALLSDHTTSYTYGDGIPLGLTIQYSGGGLWGRNHPIDRPTHLRFALAAHAGRWDEAGIQQENADWNEPLLCRTATRTEPGSSSLLDLAGSGYLLSAAYPENGSIVVRLFNASGDAAPQKIRLGFVPSSVVETDLGGNPLRSLDIRPAKTGAQIEVAMPRFGLKTLRITR